MASAALSGHDQPMTMKLLIFEDSEPIRTGLLGLLAPHGGGYYRLQS
jgi:hypothetical protein